MEYFGKDRDEESFIESEGGRLREKQDEFLRKKRRNNGAEGGKRGGVTVDGALSESDDRENECYISDNDNNESGGSSESKSDGGDLKNIAEGLILQLYNKKSEIRRKNFVGDTLKIIEKIGEILDENGI